MKNYIRNVAFIFMFALAPLCHIKAQTNCQCWVQRDTGFHLVPFVTDSNGANPTPLNHYKNDDGVTKPIRIPFSFCFYGKKIDTVYINNNGNVSFGQQYSGYVPNTFPLKKYSMVAPFWADVDTRGHNTLLPGDVVYYKLTSTYLIVQWDSVGYFNGHADKLNTFQCVMSNGTDPIIPYGNNVQFCYKTMQWTTGDVTGTNGFGTPATVGANEGDSANFIQIGLFGRAGNTYLGQFPATPYDGISWLDNQSFFLNTCSNHLGPIASGVSPCDTFVLCTGDTVNLHISFLSIKSTDSVHSNLLPPVPAGVSAIANAPGNTDTMTIQLVGSNANLGSHTVTVYGYDNEVPPDTTYISFVLQVDSNAVGTLVVSRDTICSGDSTQLKIINANTNDFKWSTGQTTDSIKVKPNVTTTYSVTLVKGKCNSLDLIHTIVVSPSPAIYITKDSICPGDSTMLSITNASAYLWSTGATTSSIWVRLDSSTTFKVVTSSCQMDSLYKRAYLVPFPVIGINGSTTICLRDSTILTAGGGVSYQWNNGTTTSNINPVTLKPVTPTTYTLTVSNNVCSQDTVFTINVIPVPVVTITPSGTICQRESTKLTATGGGTYLWSNNATSSSISVSPSSKTKYNVLVTTNGCSDSASSTISLDFPILDVCCDDSIKQGDTVHLHASNLTSYVWNPGTGLNCFTCNDPVASPIVTTIYTITGTDSLGCITNGTITVDVEIPCADFMVPTVFTPNNDGINDDLVINILNPSAYNITIFDRWGKQVFTSANPLDYWNGRINGTDNLVPDGTYYYTIKTTCGNNDYNKKGFVEVLGEK